MIKRLFLVFLCSLMLLTMISQAFGAASTALSMEISYRKAHAYEQMRIYPQATDAYNKVNDQFFQVFDPEDTSTENIELLSIGASAVFRQTISNCRDYYINMHQLIDQMEGFRKTQDQIDRMLNIVRGLRGENEAAVSRNVYENLLFSRAYNRLGWATKLLEAIAWKNYIVLPLLDIFAMVDESVEDLKQYLMVVGLPYEELYPKMNKSFFSKEPEVELQVKIEEAYNEKLKTMADTSVAFKIYQLTNFEIDKQVLSKILAKRAFNQASQLIHYYESPSVRKDFVQARYAYTLDAVLSSNNAPVFKHMDEMMRIIGIRSQ
ncbi:hypothetical protein ACFL96_11840 [Thermoproteota archaeon]